MSIYNYRRIYEQHHGPIPVDETGRSFEVHHIDGNHSNNDPANLKAVSIQEHYNIHYAQGDWGACILIAKKMKLSHTDLSEIATMSNNRRVAAGTHPFVGGAIQRERVKDGTHNFLGGQLQRERAAAGTHPFLGGNIQRETGARRVADGTHNFLDGSIQRAAQKNKIGNGTHHFLTEHTCPHCGKTGKGPAMKRHHFDNCTYT